MSKCENCIHYEACESLGNSVAQIRRMTIHNCRHFKDKSLFVEVVRCKECYWSEECDIDVPEGCLWCSNFGTMAHERHFCSYGKSKSRELENEE